MARSPWADRKDEPESGDPNHHKETVALSLVTSLDPTRSSSIHKAMANKNCASSSDRSKRCACLRSARGHSGGPLVFKLGDIHVVASCFSGDIVLGKEA